MVILGSWDAVSTGADFRFRKVSQGCVSVGVKPLSWAYTGSSSPRVVPVVACECAVVTSIHAPRSLIVHSTSKHPAAMGLQQTSV